MFSESPRVNAAIRALACLLVFIGLPSCGSLVLEDLAPCFKTVVVQIKQDGRTSNWTVSSTGPSVTVQSADWVDWSEPVFVRIRVLEVHERAGCNPDFVGREFVPAGPADVRRDGQNVTITLDGDVLAPAAPDVVSTVPAPCQIRVELKDGSQDVAHGGAPFTDFSQVENPPRSGNFFDYEATQHSTPRRRLGYTSGIYRDSGPPVRLFGWAFYKKIEVHIHVTAPCKITDVKRFTETLPGHSFTAPRAQAPDPVDPARSLHRLSPQHWYITDAPGMAVGGRDNANGKTFHRRYTLKIEGKDGANNTWRHQTSYDVWIGVNQDGRLRIPPISHSR